MVILQVIGAILVVWFLLADVLFPLIRFIMRKLFKEKAVTPVALLRDDSARTVDV
jgi:hypothetical protein